MRTEYVSNQAGGTNARWRARRICSAGNGNTRGSRRHLRSRGNDRNRERPHGYDSVPRHNGRRSRNMRKVCRTRSKIFGSNNSGSSWNGSTPVARIQDSRNLREKADENCESPRKARWDSSVDVYTLSSWQHTVAGPALGLV